MKNHNLIFLLFIILLISCQPAKHPLQLISEEVPGKEAKLFAPGIVSIEGRYEYAVSFSPKMDEIYYSVEMRGESSSVLFSKLENGEWTQPQKANFTEGKKNAEMEAFVNAQGDKIYFTAYDTMDIKIWSATRHGDAWGEAKVLDSPINNDIVFYSNPAKNGDLFYTNISKRKIYYAPNKNGEFPEALDAGIEFGLHGFIDPDQKFLLLDAYKENDASKDKDIHVCFKQKDGSWTKPINLGKGVNSDFNETCPSITPDGKFLFFGRYNEEGGLSNIYWVSAAVIHQLDPNN